MYSLWREHNSRNHGQAPISSARLLQLIDKIIRNVYLRSREWVLTPMTMLCSFGLLQDKIVGNYNVIVLLQYKLLAWSYILLYKWVFFGLDKLIFFKKKIRTLIIIRNCYRKVKHPLTMLWASCCATIVQMHYFFLDNCECIFPRWHNTHITFNWLLTKRCTIDSRASSVGTNVSP